LTVESDNDHLRFLACLLDGLRERRVPSDHDGEDTAQIRECLQSVLRGLVTTSFCATPSSS
jgi:hypothetical protein